MLNVIGNLATMTIKICIDKDWIVVLAKSSSKDQCVIDDKNILFRNKLAVLNSNVRKIDLNTGIISSLMVMGIVNLFKINTRFQGIILSVTFFAVWNFVSYFLEYKLFASVYSDISDLKKKGFESKTKFCSKEIVFSMFKGLKAFFSQGTLLMPSMSLAFLFLSVLSYDSFTIGKLFQIKA